MKIIWLNYRSKSNMNNWIEFSIQDELIYHGSEIVNFYFNDYENLDAANSELIKLCKKSSFDLFISSSESEIIFNETIQEIKRYTYTLLICMDNLHAPFMHKKIASTFDLVWLTSYETKNLFVKWGCNNIIIQPFACNPNKYKPKSGSEVNGINFIGSPYGTRKNIINKFTENNFNFHLFNDKSLLQPYEKDELSLKNKLSSFNKLIHFPLGRKLIYSKLLNSLNKEFLLNPNSNFINYPSVSFEKMSEIFSSYKISLNIIELRNTAILKTPILKLHLRTFEIPMSGGLMLTRRSKELENYFEDGKEMVTYNTYDEMIDKSRYFFNCDAKQRNTIKSNARKRSVTDHTWSKRFEPIFKNL